MAYLHQAAPDDRLPEPSPVPVLWKCFVRDKPGDNVLVEAQLAHQACVEAATELQQPIANIGATELKGITRSRNV